MFEDFICDFIGVLCSIWLYLTDPSFDKEDKDND